VTNSVLEDRDTAELDKLCERISAYEAARLREIRRIREDAQVSQEQFARKLGVSRKTVYRWEQGLSRPKPEIANRYYSLLRNIDAEFRETMSMRRQIAEIHQQVWERYGVRVS